MSPLCTALVGVKVSAMKSASDDAIESFGHCTSVGFQRLNIERLNGFYSYAFRAGFGIAVQKEVRAWIWRSHATVRKGIANFDHALINAPRLFLFSQTRIVAIYQLAQRCPVRHRGHGNNLPCCYRRRCRHICLQCQPPAQHKFQRLKVADDISNQSVMHFYRKFAALGHASSLAQLSTAMNICASSIV